MQTPEKEILQDLEEFIDDGIDSSGPVSIVYQDVRDKLEELKYQKSREYNLVVT